MLSPAQAEKAFPGKLDPNEFLDFSITCGPEMAATGQEIASVVWELSDAAVAAGITKDREAHDANNATVWLYVLPEAQTAAIFDYPGTDFVLQVTVQDTAGRIYERTIRFTVGQR